MKKTILFICNEIDYNIYNRRSAVDSILLSVLVNLSEDHYVLVNGSPLQIDRNDSNYIPAEQSPLKRMITSLIPKAIKERIKLRRLIKNSNHLTDYLTSKNIDQVDYVFELYKLGSSCGVDIAKYYKAEYVLYFDSPVVEQYEDIWGIEVPFKAKMKHFQKRAVCNADKIICYSNPVKDYLKSNGANGEVNIFQSLDYSRLTKIDQNKQSGEIIIGFIGSFMHWHRVDLLIKAFDELYVDYRNIKLYLIGNGETYLRDKQFAESLPSKEAITFTGFIDGDRLNEYKSVLDIGVMPGSNWYGIPTKVFEYSMIEIPSIAPNTPTIADVFNDGQNIMLFEWEDYSSLVAALTELISDKNKRIQIGKNANSMITQNLTSEKSKEFYRKLFV